MKNTMTSLFKTSVLPSIGDAGVHDLTLGPLQMILNRMALAHRSASFVRKARTHRKAMLEFAVDERLITANPAHGKKLVMPTKDLLKKNARYYSADEVLGLVGVATGREHLILRLLIVCGLRSQEVFLLRANDVQPGQQLIDEAFKRAESGDPRIGEPKTQGSGDPAPVPKSLEQELKAWIKRQGLSAPTYCSLRPLGGH